MNATTVHSNDAADRLLREEEAAKYLDLAPRTLQDWRLTGAGPAFVKVSHPCVRYRRADLDKWIAERVRTSTSEAAR